jgi:hypothetical protein
MFVRRVCSTLLPKILNDKCIKRYDILQIDDFDYKCEIIAPGIVVVSLRIASCALLIVFLKNFFLSLSFFFFFFSYFIQHDVIFFNDSREREIMGLRINGSEYYFMYLF